MFRFVSVTSKTKREDTLINESFRVFQNIFPNESFEVITDNTDALSVVYNRQLDLAGDDDKIVFVHDDVMIEDVFVIDKLKSAFTRFSIVGIAGMTGPVTIKPPFLWHLTGPVQNRRGEVSNFSVRPEYTKTEQFMLSDKFSIPRYTTSFGPTLSYATLIDGVFMALDVGKLREAGIRFDEQNPAKFHFYDLNLCLDAVNKGVVIGVVPIRILHCSVGLTHPTQDWYTGQEYTIRKFNEHR
jgi:hypothetical protein